MTSTINVALYWILYFYRLFVYCYNDINRKLSINKDTILLFINTYNDNYKESTFNMTLVNYRKYNNNNNISFVKYRIVIDNIFKTYYKRIFTENDILEINDIRKYISNSNILSINVVLNNNEYSININEFNLVNNKILDEPFIKWYLNKHYNISDIKAYEIVVIDNDVNIYTLTNNNYMIITNDTFIIKTI